MALTEAVCGSSLDEYIVAAGKGSSQLKTTKVKFSVGFMLENSKNMLSFGYFDNDMSS